LIPFIFDSRRRNSTFLARDTGRLLGERFATRTRPDNCCTAK
jgi:hypothetical protein